MVANRNSLYPYRSNTLVGRVSDNKHIRKTYIECQIVIRSTIENHKTRKRNREFWGWFII